MLTVLPKKLKFIHTQIKNERLFICILFSEKDLKGIMTGKRHY
jgi:hypothetical protein